MSALEPGVVTTDDGPPTSSAPPARQPGTRRPLVALLSAYGVSLVGSRLSMIALPLFVLATTGSATRTGIVAMVEMAPYVLAQALAGPVTDRLGPRRVSVVSDAASAVVVGLIPLLQAVDALHFGTLLVLVAFAGLVRGPGDGAKYVMAPAAAEHGTLPIERVLGLEDGISRAASVIGPLAAAALVTAVGAPLALVIDAVSFAVSMLVILLGVPAALGRATPTDCDGDTADGYLARLKQGARFVRKDGLLTSIIGMVATTNLLDAALGGVLLAVWARQQEGGGALMGLVVAVMGAGAVIGTVIATTAGHRLPRRATFTVSFFLVGGPRFAVLGLGAPLWIVLAVVFIGGIGAGTINPILGAVEIERIPEQLRARVLSLITSCAWTLIPFGGLLGGLLSDHLGVGTALLICGAVYTLATTVPALRPEWKEMNRHP
jgi:MFS family permease